MSESEARGLTVSRRLSPLRKNTLGRQSIGETQSLSPDLSETVGDSRETVGFDPFEPQRRRWRRPWRTTAILTIRGHRYQYDDINEADDGNGRKVLLCRTADGESAAVVEFFPLKRRRSRSRRSDR
ncbi:Uncharacterised protein [Mycobacterium tuberculosis]|nr:Uncharacterised protein [Mycobacterium tuberculosis]